MDMDQDPLFVGDRPCLEMSLGTNRFELWRETVCLNRKTGVNHQMAIWAIWQFRSDEVNRDAVEANPAGDRVDQAPGEESGIDGAAGLCHDPPVGGLA
jgi:hypothetical protein